MAAVRATLSVRRVPFVVAVARAVTARSASDLRPTRIVPRARRRADWLVSAVTTMRLLL